MESKILDGSISLSVASQAQSFFQKEGKLSGQRIELEKKKEILVSLEGLSMEEASRTLLSMSVKPESHYNERVKPISRELTELKLAITPEQRELFERVRGLLAHRETGSPMSWSELFEKLAQIALERLDPARDPKRRVKVRESGSQGKPSLEKREPAQERKTAQMLKTVQAGHSDSGPGSPPIGGNKDTRIPSLPLRREIWKRDHGKCRNCGSSHALEIDHIQDWAFGGETSEENLQLLCRSCHRRKTFLTHGERAG